MNHTQTAQLRLELNRLGFSTRSAAEDTERERLRTGAGAAGASGYGGFPRSPEHGEILEILKKQSGNVGEIGKIYFWNGDFEETI